MASWSSCFDFLNAGVLGVCVTVPWLHLGGEPAITSKLQGKWRNEREKTKTQSGFPGASAQLPLRAPLQFSLTACLGFSWLWVCLTAPQL